MLVVQIGCDGEESGEDHHQDQPHERENESSHHDRSLFNFDLTFAPATVNHLDNIACDRYYFVKASRPHYSVL